MSNLRVIQSSDNQPEPPSHAGEWTIHQIVAALSRPLPPSILASKKLKGKKITFLSWFVATRILDKYAPGWSWEILSMHCTDDRLFLSGRLTIPTADGNVSRDATGTEQLKRFDDEGNLKEVSYGDPSSNAESMAFRRAAAKFGLGLYLYNK